MDESQVGGIQKAIIIVLWCVALLLNGSNTVLLCKAARRRSSWANVLLLSLAVVDLLCLVVVLLPTVVALFVKSLLHTHRPLCHVQGFALNAFILLSYSIIGCVSVDQFLAVCHPFAYSIRIVRFPKRSLKIIAVVLLGLLSVSVMVSSLSLVLGAGLKPLRPPLMCLFDLSSSSNGGYKKHVIGWTNVMVILALSSLLLYCTCCIGIGLYKSSRRARDDGVKRSPNIRQQVNIAKLSMIIAIVLLACCLPFMVVCILQLVNLSHDKVLMYVAVNILLLNTVFNPILYVLTRSTMRQQYLQCCRTIYRRAIPCKPDVVTEVPVLSIQHPANVNIEHVTPAVLPTRREPQPHTSTPSVPSKMVHMRVTRFAQSQGSISAIDRPLSCTEMTPHRIGGGLELKSLSMDLENDKQQVHAPHLSKELPLMADGANDSYQPKMLNLQGGYMCSAENDYEGKVTSV